MKKCLNYKAKYKIRIDTASDTHAEVAAGRSLILKGFLVRAQTKLSQICEHCHSIRTESTDKKSHTNNKKNTISLEIEITFSKFIV